MTKFLSSLGFAFIFASLTPSNLYASPFYFNAGGPIPIPNERTICGEDDNLNMHEQSEAMKEMGRPVGSLWVYERDKDRSFMCTGTLVGKDLFLTARHCREACEDMSVRFGYLTEGRQETFRCKEIVEAGSFESSQDYMFLRLEGSPGVEWGWYPLSDKELTEKEQLMMIHHPRGTPMKVSLNECQFVKENNGLLHHRCDTRPGSSGTGILLPDFETPENTRIVAVHAFGGCGSSPTSSNSGPAIRNLAESSELVRSLIKD